MDGLITPRAGSGICPVCFNFTRERDGRRCRACQVSPAYVSAMLAVSYAPAGGALHRDLADYKRTAEPAVSHLITTFAAVLSETITGHQACLAAAAGVTGFDTVMVVPSGDARRDHRHPLRAMVSEHVPAVGSRYRDGLWASGAVCPPHTYDPKRFWLEAPVDGADILLIDDVWTTGATVQSAAAVLWAAGAASVSALVIGRYVNAHWGGIADRLKALAQAEDRCGCSHCHDIADPTASSYTHRSPPRGA